MAAERALEVTIVEYKNILVPVEGTDPQEYVLLNQLVQYKSTLDMNNFNSISNPLDEYGQPTGGCYVLLNNGDTLLLTNDYEEVLSKYISYLNGG